MPHGCSQDSIGRIRRWCCISLVWSISLTLYAGYDGLGYLLLEVGIVALVFRETLNMRFFSDLRVMEELKKVVLYMVFYLRIYQ